MTPAKPPEFPELEQAFYRALFPGFLGISPSSKKRAWFAFTAAFLIVGVVMCFAGKEWKKRELQSCCLRTVLGRLTLKMTKTNPSLFIKFFLILWIYLAICKRSLVSFLYLDYLLECRKRINQKRVYSIYSFDFFFPI